LDKHINGPSYVTDNFPVTPPRTYRLQFLWSVRNTTVLLQEVRTEKEIRGLGRNGGFVQKRN